MLVVDLPPAELNALVGAINPRDIARKETESEINFVIERWVLFLFENLFLIKLFFHRFPKHKRYISEIYDEIADVLSDKSSTIVALYSFPESSYRIII